MICPQCHKGMLVGAKIEGPNGLEEIVWDCHCGNQEIEKIKVKEKTVWIIELRFKDYMLYSRIHRILVVLKDITHEAFTIITRGE